MTPNREKWWRGLSPDEKQTRLKIQIYKIDIKINKIEMQCAKDDYLKAFFADEIRIDKERINRLRKSITLYVPGEAKLN